MDEAKNRGVVLMAVVNGLNGFPGAITAVFRQITVQLVHLLRQSLDFASPWRGAQGQLPGDRQAANEDSPHRRRHDHPSWFRPPLDEDPTGLSLL
jgi:transposase-like protein